MATEKESVLKILMHNMLIRRIGSLTRDNALSVPREFLHLTRNSNAALVLALACEASAAVPNGWFRKSQKEWTEETSLTREQTEHARKLLREKGFLEEKREVPGGPLHFRVNGWNLYRALTALKNGKESSK
jgi:hypothetical protein